MDEKRFNSLDEQGRKLGAAFSRAEAAEATPAKRMPRRLKMVAAGFAAVLLLAAVPAYVTLGGHRVSSLSTAEALEQVAAAAESSPLPFARPDQYLYTQTKSTAAMGFPARDAEQKGYADDPYSAIETNENELWASVGSEGAFVVRRVGLKWISPAEKAAAKKNVDRSLIAVPHTRMGRMPTNGNYYFAAKKMTRAQIENLPTEPRAIYKKTLLSLNSIKWSTSDRTVWSVLLDTLTGYSYPPKLRAGVIRALGLIPGVRSLGTRKDPLGRSGLAFSHVDDGVREVVILSPESAAVLYARSELVGSSKFYSDWPKGTVIGEQLFTKQVLVDQLPKWIRDELAERAAKRGK